MGSKRKNHMAQHDKAVRIVAYRLLSGAADALRHHDGAFANWVKYSFSCAELVCCM